MNTATERVTKVVDRQRIATAPYFTSNTAIELNYTPLCDQCKFTTRSP